MSAPPSEVQVRELDRAVWRLSVDGELRGHLACRVLTMRFPSRQPWPWFVTVWLDGTKEFKEEDYGPEYPTVAELLAGHFDGHERSLP